MFERMNPHKAAPELQKPMVALSKHISENIDPVLFELVKLRASMINGCGHCVDIHSSDALRAGESTARLFGLSAWWEHPLYTDKERAALGLTDAATRFGAHGVPDDVFDTARAQFDERELTYLVAGIGLINMWNRFGVTFQLSPPSARAHVG
ncbi:MAG: carboxymuconolactone decarboxylase family protein [Acidimicrobiia bacterium]